MLGPSVLCDTEEITAGGHRDEDVGVLFGANEDGYIRGMVHFRCFGSKNWQ